MKRITRSPHEAILAAKDASHRRETAILAHLARRPMTVRQLATATMWGATTIDAALLRLALAGKVRRDHGHQGNIPAVWSLVEDGGQ